MNNNHFLPAGRRRQRLDPTRHLKSRELWNQVRFHASASQHTNSTNNNSRGSGGNSTSSSSNSNIKWAWALLQAVAYEIQPFRIKPAIQRMKIFLWEEEGLKQIATYVVEHVKSILSFAVQLFTSIYQLFKKTDIQSIKSYVIENKSFFTKSTVILIGLRLYYHMVLYLHELLHAGPVVIILTLLTLLFTIGLGDNTGSDIPSAYSVFNRGFQRILGTVDAEELARQYAGGMAAAGRGGGGMNMNLDDGLDDGGVWVNEEEGQEQEEEEQNLVNERRRRRRLERLQQRRNEEGADEARNANAQPQAGEEEAEGEEPDLAEDGGQNGQDNQRANGDTPAATARRTGKKARRRNLEHRREMQRQRQAAAAMGFGAGGAADDMREREARMALE